MSCTGRIQKRLANALDYVAKTSFGMRVTEIAKAVSESFIVRNLSHGLRPIPQTGKIIVSSFVKSNDEANAVTLSSIKTNVIYYALPVGIGLTVRYGLSCIPGFDDSKAAVVTDYALKIPYIYFLSRRLFDNTLYTINTSVVHHSKLMREESLRVLNKLIPELSACLAGILAKSDYVEEFNVLLNEEITKALLKYFEEPEKFRNIIFKNLTAKAKNDLKVCFDIALNDEKSAFHSSLSKGLSDALINVIFARLVPGFAKKFNDNDIDIRDLFAERIFDIKIATEKISVNNFADEILKCINDSCKCIEKDDISAMLDDFAAVPENIGFALQPEEFCSDHKKAQPVSLVKIAFENLIFMPYLLYHSTDSVIGFILNAEIFGRGFLDLKLGVNCEAHRSQALASMKLLAFVLGAPIAAMYPLIESPFLRDAVISLMMILWTRAVLEDTRPLPHNADGYNLFRIPQAIVNRLFLITKKIAPYIEKAFEDSARRERLVVKITNFLKSPFFDWSVALVLGDTYKHVKKLEVTPKAETYWQMVKKAIDQCNVSIQVKEGAKTKAADVLIEEVPSVNQYIEYNGAKLTSGIYYARRTRDVPGPVVFIAKPVIYIAKPLLSRRVPAFLIASLSLFLNILKKDELERIFKALEASFERSQFAPLKLGEQKAEMQVSSQEVALQTANDYYAAPPEVTVTLHPEFASVIHDISKEEKEEKREPKRDFVEIKATTETQKITTEQAIEDAMKADIMLVRRIKQRPLVTISQPTAESKRAVDASLPVVTKSDSAEEDMAAALREDTFARLRKKANKANPKNPIRFDFSSSRDKSKAPVSVSSVNTYSSKDRSLSTKSISRL